MPDLTDADLAALRAAVALHEWASIESGQVTEIWSAEIIARYEALLAAVEALPLERRRELGALL